MNEGDAAIGVAGAGLLVDEAEALLATSDEGGVDVIDSVGDVVDAFASLLQVFSDVGFGGNRVRSVRIGAPPAATMMALTPKAGMASRSPRTRGPVFSRTLRAASMSRVATPM